MTVVFFYVKTAGSERIHAIQALHKEKWFYL